MAQTPFPGVEGRGNYLFCFKGVKHGLRSLRVALPAWFGFKVVERAMVGFNGGHFFCAVLKAYGPFP